jgi:drug/metabolite transporter (DMT)-like permease
MPGTQEFGYHRLMIVTETKDKTERRYGVEFLGLLLLVILLKPFSNLFLAWGMKGMAGGVSMNPLFYFRAMFEPLVALGMLMQLFWLLFRMKLLSLADLSFVLPVTAAGYVITTFLGRIFLHEQVSTERWIAVLFISLGTAVAGSTRGIKTL